MVSEGRREYEKLSRDIQKAAPPLVNLQLSNPKFGRFFGRVVFIRGMDSNIS